jgi:ABC-type phosphate transport system substrate-binding protein
VNVKFAKRAAIATGIAALSFGLAMPVAQADPTPDPVTGSSFRELVGVGSDTTQDVMNGLGNAIADPDGDPASLLIASYDAVDPVTGAPNGTIVTRDGHAAVVRPNGSGAGVNALKADLDSGANNFDFARSSSKPTTAGSEGTWIPFALDAVTAAVSGSSTLPANFTTQQLQRAYNCEDPATGTALPAGSFPVIGGITVHPLVPQAGSGTRKFWAQQLGFNAVNLPACVSDVDKDGVAVQEHDGGSLKRTVAADNSEDIAPFSIAQFIAQTNSATTGVRDRRHGAQLRSIDSQAPIVSGALNTAFPITRDVYNVVPTANLAVPDITLAFVGANSQICQNTTVIQQFGFGAISDCGSTTLTGALAL